MFAFRLYLRIVLGSVNVSLLSKHDKYVLNHDNYVLNIF